LILDVFERAEQFGCFGLAQLPASHLVGSVFGAAHYSSGEACGDGAGQEYSLSP
jgi:hypothetical protein